MMARNSRNAPRWPSRRARPRTLSTPGDVAGPDLARRHIVTAVVAEMSIAAAVMTNRTLPLIGHPVVQQCGCVQERREDDGQLVAEDERPRPGTPSA